MVPRNSGPVIVGEHEPNQVIEKTITTKEHIACEQRGVQYMVFVSIVGFDFVLRYIYIYI